MTDQQDARREFCSDVERLLETASELPHVSEDDIHAEFSAKKDMTDQQDITQGD